MKESLFRAIININNIPYEWEKLLNNKQYLAYSTII